jgi:hypothetical protein
LRWAALCAEQLTGMTACACRWDPDGSGIRPVPSQELAKEIWEKAKAKYASEIAATGIFTGLFMLSPL